MINFNPKELADTFDNKETSFEFLKSKNIPIDNFLEEAKKDELIKPNLNDLSRLLKICEVAKPSKIIEYGCGYSSYVFYHYLKNKEECNNSKKYLQIIEVHQKYLDLASNRFKESNGAVEVIKDVCQVKGDLYRNDGSHLYLAKYRFSTDIIYLDSPDPEDIFGTNFLPENQRIPISSDILFIESWLIPGTIIVIDGRMANVEYLKRNLKRNWRWGINHYNDCSIGILVDDPLGKKNIQSLKERGLF